MTSEFLKSGSPSLISALDGLSEKVWSLLGWGPAKKSAGGSNPTIQPFKPIINGTFAHHDEDETAEAIERKKSSTLRLLLKDTIEFIGNQSGLLKDGVSQVPRLGQDLHLVLDLIHSKATNEGINDKEYLTEGIIQILASLPTRSETSHKVSGTLIKGLWDSLLHPPLTYLGRENQYRSADDSNNNFLHPRLGAAGTPYARSVAPLTMNRPYPNPGEVFDKLLARKGKPTEHPNKISSVLFHFATIIIHDLFRTGDDSVNPDYNVSSTSSYLSLSPLYGNNEKEQLAVRALKDGLLKPDTFHEHRILGFPPGVSALLICFNRFHNYVAKRLKSINQDGRFSPNQRLSNIDAAKKVDDDLFNAARLVTNGLYVNIILGDYVRTILNMNYAPDSTWSLDPRETAQLSPGPIAPLGTGNQVSVEFNLIYRWHATLSVKDERWTEAFFQRLFPNKDPSTLALPEFLKELLVWRNGIMAQDPSERTFEGLQRTTSGAFETRDLAKIILESTKDVSSAFGACQVPTVLKLIEVLGIEQSRQWHTGTLNELRKFMGLTPHKTFEDINPDPKVQASIKELYKDPNLVEMYPGLVFEAAKDPYYPGSGLCGNYTTTRAILSDAATLVRSDRFYTLDWNPSVMTDWGFDLIQIGNPADKHARGGKLHTLLDIALPNVYPEDSVWKLFPFTVPNEIERIFKKQGVAGQYDFQRLI